MQRLFIPPLLVFIGIAITCNSEATSLRSSIMPIGNRYIEFIRQMPTDKLDSRWELLFCISVKKVINSKTVCSNRAQLIEQMCDVKKTYGIAQVQLLELIESIDPKINVIRFEITYNDQSIETVITIITCDEKGLIKEINEVFGEKEIYQWQTSL